MIKNTHTVIIKHNIKSLYPYCVELYRDNKYVTAFSMETKKDALDMKKQWTKNHSIY